MLQLFIETDYSWVSSRIDGSAATVTRGMGATKHNPLHCDVRWFTGNQAIILDGGGEWAPEQISEVHATWKIPVEQDVINATEHIFLVIACTRAYGGLHTQNEGQNVSISLNDEQLDYFRLKDIPEGHTDYFYRSPGERQLPRLLEVDPVLGACATVYSWQVQPHHLRRSSHQIVGVALDPEVRWDIDYVSLLTSKRIHNLRPGVVQILLVILGALLGFAAALILGMIF